MLTSDQLTAVAQSHGLTVTNPTAAQPASAPGASAAQAFASKVGYQPNGATGGTAPQSTGDVVKSIAGNIGSNFNSRAANVDTIKSSDEPLPEKLFQTAGEGAGLITDAATDVIKPAIKDNVKDTVKDAVGAVANTPAAQALKAAWDSFSSAHPEAAENIKATGNLASILPIGEAVGAGVKGAVKGLTDTAKVAEDTTKAAGTAIKETAGAAKQAVKPTLDPAAQALKDVTPDYEKATPTQKEKMIGQTVKDADGNSVPRVNEGGVTKGRTITSTKLEQDAATELQKVPGYKPEMTNLEKANLVKGEIAKQAPALKESLKAEGIVVPKKEIYKTVKTAIDNVPEESLLLQSSDPAIKNYTRLLKNAVSKEPGTLDGVLNIRQNLDAAYANARGKLAYDSDKLSALDEVHTAARDALNKYLIDHAVGTDVKASLKAQWDLYRASDELTSKAAREEGSKVGRFMQNNPKTAKFIKLGAHAAGLGAGLHLLP